MYIHNVTCLLQPDLQLLSCMFVSVQYPLSIQRLHYDQWHSVDVGHVLAAYVPEKATSP